MRLLTSALIALLLTTACGQGNAPVAAPEESSETLSLTGIPGGGKTPCQDAFAAISWGSAYCLKLPAAGNSHPAIEVAVAIQILDAYQAQKAREAVREFERHWQEMRLESSNVNQTTFGQCLRSRVNNRMFAEVTAIPAPAQNLETGISYAVLNLQYLFEAHAKAKRPLYITGVEVDGIFGRAYRGKEGYREDNYGDFMFSNYALRNPDVTPLTLAGTVFHELLHRKGYSHPELTNENRDEIMEEYAATMTSAAGACIREDNAISFGLSTSDHIFDD